MVQNRWDTHMHLYGTPQAFPVVEGATYRPMPRSLNEYCSAVAGLSIERAVLVQPSVYGSDNSFVLSQLAAHPDYLRGIITLSEPIDAAVAEQLHGLGVRGARVNLVQAGGGALQPVMASIDAFRHAGMHVQLVARPREGLLALVELQKAGATVVLDHMLLLEPDKTNEHFAVLMDHMQKGHVYVKISGLYRLHRFVPHRMAAVDRMVRILMDEHGDRLLWGSDWPHPDYDGPRPAPERLLDSVLEADTKTRARVLSEVPERLYA